MLLLSFLTTKMSFYLVGDGGPVHEVFRAHPGGQQRLVRVTHRRVRH